MRNLLFAIMLPFMVGKAFAQKTKSGYLSNQVNLGVNGFGDREGPLLQFGYIHNLNHWQLQANLLFASYGSNHYNVANRFYVGTNHWALQLLAGRCIDLGRWLSLAPKIGVTANYFNWKVLTGNFGLDIGERMFPKNSSGNFQESAIGYWIDIPFQFKVSKQVQLTLSAQYGNDQLGSSIYAVGTGVRVKLFEKRKK